MADVNFKFNFYKICTQKNRPVKYWTTDLTTHLRITEFVRFVVFFVDDVLIDNHIRLIVVIPRFLIFLRIVILFFLLLFFFLN